MSAKVYRLISGEELIGDLLNGTGESLVLKNVAVIIMQQTKDGQVGMGMMPFMPYAESEKVTIHKSAIAAECEPALQLVNEYNRIFGSGIQIANVMPGK